MGINGYKLKGMCVKKFSALIAFATLSTSCATNTKTTFLLDADSEYYTYSADNITAFDISPDGILYAGEETDKNIICSYDLSGDKNELCEISQKTDALAYNDGELYYTQATDSGTDIYRLSMQKNTIERFCTLLGFYSVKNLQISNNCAYILGLDDSRSDVKGVYQDEFGTYSYNGEKLLKISLDDGEIIDSKVEFPQAFSVFEDEVVVYAADESGFYLTNFAGDSKNYNDLGNITALEMYEQDKFIFYSDSMIFKLSSGTLRHEDGIAEALEKVILLNGNDIRYEGGFVFIYNRYGQFNNGYIERFKASDYIKSNNKIKFISAEYSFDDPFGCGYVIEKSELDNESFALTILSQDTNYDMCIINSEQDYAANIRNKGSFYPLNEIEGVKAYLDKCFPYVKEAAMTEEGEIWMLPVLLNAGVVYFNSDNCMTAGISLSNEMLFNDFVVQCKKAEKSEYNYGYSVHCYQLTQNMLFDYLTRYSDFDTTVFRDFAVFTKENANISNFPSYMPTSNPAEDNFFYGDGNGASYFLFGYNRDSNWQRNYAELSFLNAYPAPKLEQGEKNAVTCVFITVNPNSSNLEATLEYISSLSKYLAEQYDSLMLTDKALYSETEYMSDLYRIYENGEIYFNISSEIIFDDYIKYCSDEITLNELISEANRKYTAYLNE